ncbi:MAG: response regulator [Gammaproteobacteria bacterium]|nr:MAG: response regulator [Gammaproteobacteria bacterium]
MAKVLVVDDSPTELHILTRYLEEGGHQTLTAADGKEGVEVARSEQPDLILMDVVMPGLNGFQATRKISRDPTTRSIPVVMITTKDQDTDREWGLRQGARAYLVKPVTEAELLCTVEEVLG